MENNEETRDKVGQSLTDAFKERQEEKVQEVPAEIVATPWRDLLHALQICLRTRLGIAVAGIALATCTYYMGYSHGASSTQPVAKIVAGR